MLAATEMDLQREGSDMIQMLRIALLEQSGDRVMDVGEIQRHIRLANNMRRYYIERSNDIIVKNAEDRIKLFEILEREGVLQEIMNQPFKSLVEKDKEDILDK
jgi:hypothetical protein